MQRLSLSLVLRPVSFFSLVVILHIDDHVLGFVGSINYFYSFKNVFRFEFFYYCFCFEKRE
jgi:hypothetical protein